MSLLQSIVALLRKGAPRFSVLEADLLAEVESLLDEDRAERLKKRVKSINLVQRLDGGREVNAYSIKDGKPFFEEKFKLIECSVEKKLAEFSFLGKNGSNYRGKAWLVDGQFFSIEFDQPTEHILDYRPINLKLSILL